MVARLVRDLQRELRGWWRDGHVHLFVSAVGGILSYLPVMCGQTSLVETDSLHAAISSRTVAVVVTACLTMTLPLLLDIALDARNKYMEYNKKRKTLGEAKRESEIKETKKKAGDVGKASFTDAEKVSILVGVIFAAPSVFQLAAYEDNLGLINLCGRNCMVSFVGGAILAAIQRIEPLWTPKVCFFMVISLSISCVVGPFGHGTLEGVAGVRAVLAQQVLFAVPVGMALLACLKWLAVRAFGDEEGVVSKGLLRRLSRGRATSPTDAPPAGASGAATTDADAAAATAAAAAASAAAAPPPKKKTAKEAEKEAQFGQFQVRLLLWKPRLSVNLRPLGSQHFFSSTSAPVRAHDHRVHHDWNRRARADRYLAHGTYFRYHPRRNIPALFGAALLHEDCVRAVRQVPGRADTDGHARREKSVCPLHQVGLGPSGRPPPPPIQAH